MPWTIQRRHRNGVDPSPGCRGSHRFTSHAGDGWDHCEACGALLLCPDPGPGEVFRVTLIPCDGNLRRLPKHRRRSIQIEWGERTQDDGTIARVYRLIDRQNDRYVEKVTFADGTVLERDETLREHRGHGSARHARPGSTHQSQRRAWVAF